MTIRSYKVFIAVCECGGITAASKQLYISQPSVSHVINDLEEHYGVALFDRLSKKLYLTEAGKTLYNYAVRVVSLMDEMEDGMRGLLEGYVFKVGACTTIGELLLPTLIDNFSKIHADVDIRSLIGRSDIVLDSLMKNELDLALIEGFVDNDNLMQTIFLIDEIVLVCGPNHPLAQKRQVDIADLDNERFILREKGTGVRDAFDNMSARVGMKINIVGQSVNSMSIIESVHRGLGVAALPYVTVKNQLENNYISRINIPGLFIENQFSLIYHKDKIMNNYTSDFVRMCMNFIQNMI